MPTGVYERTVTPPDVRFFAKVQPTSTGCWVWTATKQGGYGHFKAESRRTRRIALAHRWAYEFFLGPIPAGLTLDHLCRNRSCVNPLHLEPVTNHRNLLRGVCPAADNARKTHCKNGHPLNRAKVRRRGIERSCSVCRYVRNAAMAS